MFPLTSMLRVVLEYEALGSTWVENQIKIYLFVTKTVDSQVGVDVTVLEVI